MVLVFILILAILAWAILRELDRGEEAALPAIACPGCDQPADAEWLVCPRCRRLLQESCSACSGHYSVRFAYCPHCGRKREGRG